MFACSDQIGKSKLSDTDQDFEYYKDLNKVNEYDAKRFRHGWGFILHNTQLYYISNLLKRSSSDRILDVPVGTARISKVLPPKVIGLDISYPMLAVARTMRADMPLTIGSAFSLPYRRESFDALISLRFIRHLQIEDRKRVYSEFHRVLDDGGLLLFDAIPKFQEFNYRGKRQYSGRIFDALYENPAELFDEVSIYFDKVTLLTVQHFPEWFDRVRENMRLHRARRLFDKIVSRIDPHLKVITTRSREWIVICEK